MKGIAVNRLNRNVSWIVLLIVSMLCLFNMSSVLAHAMLVKAEPAKEHHLQQPLRRCDFGLMKRLNLHSQHYPYLM